MIEDQQPFWLTLGAALAIWRLSAAMRATMGALDRIYDEDDDDRSFVSEIKTSIGLSLTTTSLVLVALSVLYLGPVAVHVESTPAEVASLLVRWLLALALGVFAFGLIVHYAPAHPQPLGWVSRGTLLAALCWLSPPAPSRSTSPSSPTTARSSARSPPSSCSSPTSTSRPRRSSSAWRSTSAPAPARKRPRTHDGPGAVPGPSRASLLTG